MLLVAGSAKLADLRYATKAMQGLGLPGAFWLPWAPLIAVLEIGTAAVLLSTSLAIYGAAMSFVIMAGASATVGYNLAVGERPECGCFGSLAPSRINRLTLLRTCFFCAASAWLAWLLHDRPAFALGAQLSAGLLSQPVAVRLLGAETMVVICLGVFYLSGRHNAERLARSIGEDTPRANPSPRPPAAGAIVGTAAPEFELRGLDGAVQSLASLRSLERPVLLVFVEPGNGACRSLLGDLAPWQSQSENLLTLVVIGRGRSDQNAREFKTLGIRNFLIQRDREVSDKYGCPGMPGGLTIGTDGLVRVR